MEDLQRIAQLRQQLNEWSYQYYVLDDPTVPDYDYDMDLRELEQLEAKHPETITSTLPPSGWGARPDQLLPRSTIRCPWSLCRMCSPTRRCWSLLPGSPPAPPTRFCGGAQGGRSVHRPGV